MNENAQKNDHLQTCGNVERSQMPKFKLRLNFNNNLNNNHKFNSFRKKLIKDDMNPNIKSKFDNFHNIIKTESNEINLYNKLRNNAIIMQNIFHKNENEINNNIPTLNIHIKDNNYMPTYKIPNRNLLLKITDSNGNKTILNSNSNSNSKKLFLGKSKPLNNVKNIVANKINSININKFSSFKKYVNDHKSSFTENSNRKIVFNKSHPHNRNPLQVRNIYNLYLNKNNKKSKSIDNKNIQIINHETIKTLNTHHKINSSLILNKKSDVSPWKNICEKIVKKGKDNLSPYIDLIKKNDMLNGTPKRAPNLFYNNINININTINCYEKNNKKIKENSAEKRKNKNKNTINVNEVNNNLYTNKNRDINFSKIIPDANNKNTIYYYDKKNNNTIIGQPVGAGKEGGLYVLRTEGMKRNLGMNNLSKNLPVKKGVYKSEEKWKQKAKIKKIPYLNNNNIYFFKNKKKLQ